VFPLNRINGLSRGCQILTALGARAGQARLYIECEPSTSM
jgi:hypothetical protein